MVDHVVGAEVPAPLRRLGARGRSDHDEIRELPGELDRDRADAAGAADDQDRGGGTRNGRGDVEPVEQHLPSGQRGKR